MVVSCTGIKTLNQLLIHAEQGEGKERLRWLRGKNKRKEMNKKGKQLICLRVYLTLALCISSTEAAGRGFPS